MAKIEVNLKRVASLPYQYARGATDYVPVTPGTDVLPDELGWWPRGVRANADGDLVIRWMDSEADRTHAVVAGEVLFGYVVQVLAGSTCEPELIR